MASSADTPVTITLGTRRSALARAQTDIIAALIREKHPDVNVAIHATDPLGDRDKTTALYALNDKNLWTAELDEMLARGQVDAVVHSCKDMPTGLEPGLVIGAISRRADARDALVLPAAAHSLARGKTAHEILGGLPAGSVLGTSSLRRSAQLRRAYPHLRFEICRGNVPTRLAKLDGTFSAATTDSNSSRPPPQLQSQSSPPSQPPQLPQEQTFAAIVIACAGLDRLALSDRITAHIDGTRAGGSCHWAVGQGAIAVQIRANDALAAELLASAHHTRTGWAVAAERQLMRVLEGGCSVPIGVQTAWLSAPSSEPEAAAAAAAAVAAPQDKTELKLTAVVVSVDGSEAVQAEGQLAVHSDAQAEQLGTQVAALLMERGAGKILDAIREDKLRSVEEAKRQISDVGAYVAQQQV